jgi:imidazolonepropionase-like amidohydrolase
MRITTLIASNKFLLRGGHPQLAACLLFLAVALLPALPLRGTQAQSPNATHAIRNARIVTVTGATIARGTVLIRDGKIAAVGENVSVPADAKVIDARGMSVYPGMIDSGTYLGLTEIGSITETQDTNELGDFNPHMRAIVAVHPASELIPVTRANGITTALTGPRGGLISGQCALINLDGWTPQEMTLKAPIAMRMNYPGGGGGRRGGGSFAIQGQGGDQRERQLEALRKKLEDAQAYAKAKEAQARDKSLPALPTDLALEALIPVVKGELPVVFTANRERDIRGAIELAEKYQLKIIITGGDEAHKVGAWLKQKNIPVILGPVLSLPRGEDDPYDAGYTKAAELHKAGVKFAFSTEDAAYARSLPYHAGTAAAFGLPKEEALKAVTIYPAQIFGVDKLIGSVEAGKLANLIITDGDPLEPRTNVKHMFINGHPVDLSSRHTKLYDKYNNRP